MAKLYIICGHGAGDPGACANGYSEAERVRVLGKKIKEIGGSNVVLMDTSRNWYADNGISTYKFPKDAMVCELHLDSAGASAKGGHVIIKEGFSPDQYDKNLAKFIGGMFPGRSETIVPRAHLANVNRAAARGVNYRLVECCFISSASDIAKFNAHLDEVARGIIKAFNLTSAAEPPKADKTETPVSENKTSYLVKVTADVLNVRSGPGVKYGIETTVKAGDVYTIVKTNGNWGKLKSGAGWISLEYTERV